MTTFSICIFYFRNKLQFDDNVNGARLFAVPHLTVLGTRKIESRLLCARIHTDCHGIVGDGITHPHDSDHGGGKQAQLQNVGSEGSHMGQNQAKVNVGSRYGGDLQTVLRHPVQ